jgi:hypothetical protein
MHTLQSLALSKSHNLTDKVERSPGTTRQRVCGPACTLASF